VLAAVGGAAAMLLWLKLGGALGLRQVAIFRWSYLAGALVVGAALGLLVQGVWAIAGTRVARLLGYAARPSDFRLVWGGSALPQVFALVVLLPLDLMIAGQATFTTARFADSLAAAWASLSIALAVALSVWSLYLFIRGTHVATQMSLSRVVLVTLVAGVCFLAVGGLALLLAVSIAGS
jgi:hypothetical protein